jgi:hypothetical protein
VGDHFSKPRDYALCTLQVARRYGCTGPSRLRVNRSALRSSGQACATGGSLQAEELLEFAFVEDGDA